MTTPHLDDLKQDIPLADFLRSQSAIYFLSRIHAVVMAPAVRETSSRILGAEKKPLVSLSF